MFVYDHHKNVYNIYWMVCRLTPQNQKYMLGCQVFIASLERKIP
jgi:hypothetical protein